MKIIKLNIQKLSKRLILLTSIASLVGVTFFSPLVCDFFYTLWMPAALLLIIVLTPAGSITITTKQSLPKASLPYKIGFILLLELALLFTFASFCHMIGTITPSNLSSNPHLFSDTLPILMSHYGLFSWTSLALLTLGFAYLSANKNKDSYYSRLCAPLIKNTEPGQTFATIVNTGAQLSNRFALSGLVILLAVVLANWLLSGTRPVIHGFNLATTLFMILTIVIACSKQINNLLARATLTLPPIVICLIIAAGLAMILTILSIPPSLSHLTLHLPKIIHTYTQQDNHARWLIISLCWWFFWSPLLAPICARLCYGYTVRHTIVTIMTLPCICVLILSAYSHNIINLQPLFHFINTNPFGQMLSTLSILGLLLLIFSKKNTANTVLASMPLPKNNKHRSPLLVLKGLLTTSVISLGLYLCFGPYLLAWIWLVYICIPSLTTLCISLNVIKQLTCHLFNKT